jgi:SAM-dependent methyltransferase
VLDPEPSVRGDPGLWADLRALVERTYDVGALERITGIRPLSLASMDRLAECRVLLDGDPACTTVVDLFVLGMGVDAARAELGLAPLDIGRLAAAGLLELEGDCVRATVSILPFDGLWLVGDRLNERGAPEGQRVPNTDLSTVLTASVVSSRAAASMLDLGTGTGVHALRAARHCTSVVGVDINPRALMYARFNAGLNGVGTAEWIDGEFFDHLDGREFDLVVANPPFIISPDRDDPHRFGGEAGDGLSREVTRGAAEHLAEGGTASVLCDVALSSGQDWIDALAPWVAGTGCDAVLLRLSTTSAAAYALRYHDRRVHASSNAFELAVRAWVDSYRVLGIERIGSAVIVLRKRTACDNWIEGFDLAANAVGTAGEHIARIFEGIDHFGALPREQLLGERLCLADGHELRQRLRLVDGAYVPDAMQLNLPGFPLVATVSAEGLPVLAALDGTRPLDELIAETAASYELSETALQTQLLPEIRELGKRGLVRPRSSPSPPP